MSLELPGFTAAHGLDSYIAKMCVETPGSYGPHEPVQSRYDLNRDPQLAPLCEAVFNMSRAIARDVYSYKPDYTVEITSMWGNAQHPGASFASHMHYNNMFSGVFYLNEHPDFPPITFWRNQETTLDPMKEGFNAFNQGSFFVNTKRDVLLMFPSWLRHSVPVNTTSATRLGVSFNVMLRGGFYNTIL